MSENPIEVIKSRLAVLEQQRDELRARLEMQLMPINTVINELRHILALLGDPTLSKEQAPILQMIPEQFDKPVQLQDLPVSERLAAVNTAPTANKDDPGNVILSPKSKTPILSNAASLRRALSGR